MRTISLFSLLCSLVLVTGLSAQTKPTVPFFGNTKCPVSGKPVDRELAVEHEGQKIYVCCAKCIKTVEDDKAAYFKKAYPEAQLKDLSAEKCPVMNKPAKGAKAKTIDFQGHRLRVCCAGCVTKFKKQPNRYLAPMVVKGKITALDNEKCPVMPGRAVKPDIFVLHNDKLIGFCCTRCRDRYIENPERYAAKVRELTKKDG